MSSLKLDNVYNSLFNFLKQDRGSCLLLFLIGLTLRGIPELLVSYYPVGYETITYYAPPMMTFLGRSVVDVFVEFLRVGPLFYVLMWLVANVTGAHAFVILKVVGPLLYGSLIVSFFVFLKRGLKLDWKMAFVATLLLAFQVAVLRESWDRFMTLLGLTFLFSAFVALKSNSKFKWWLVAFLAVLTALAREYIAFVLFVAVLGFAVLEKRDRVKSLIALTPAITFFGVTYYGRGVWENFVSNSPQALESYAHVVQDAASIFVVCYLAILPFVLRGWRRDKLLDPILGWLLLGSFSLVISPWLAVRSYSRWLMLLVFLFSIYAVKGFERFQLFNGNRLKVLIAIVLIFMVIGVGYSTGAFSYVGMVPNSYVAVNLVQSSIAWDQVDDVIGSLRWLNDHAVSNSSILAEERFFGWTLIYFERANTDVKVMVYGANSLPTATLEKALDNGFRSIYLIWYTDASFENFRMLHSQNSISIFQYEQ